MAGTPRGQDHHCLEEVVTVGSHNDAGSHSLEACRTNAGPLVSGLAREPPRSIAVVGVFSGGRALGRSGVRAAGGTLLGEARGKDRGGVARQLLGPPRQSSVFPAPLRPLLAASSHAEPSELGRQIKGRELSIQVWWITAKTRKVDDLLGRLPGLRGRLREIHPEVCFYLIKVVMGFRPPAPHENGVCFP